MSRALITSGVEQDRSRPRLSPACLRSCWKPLVAWVLLAGVILASPSVVGAALADEGRFYLGITGTPEWLDTSYKKTVDNTSPLNMTSQSGKVNRDRDSADATGYGFGLLAGVRRVATRVRVRFHGCLTSEWCQTDEFTTGANTHNENFTAWTSGAGLEKMFGSRLGLRGEVRYTGYLAEDWVSVQPEGRRGLCSSAGR